MSKKKPASSPALPHGPMPANATISGGVVSNSETAPMMVTELAPRARAPVPWEDKSKDERLSDLTDAAMEQSRRILGIEFDPDDLSAGNVRRVAIVSNHALAIIATQVKVDETKLRAARESGGSLQEFYRQYGSASEERSS